MKNPNRIFVLRKAKSLSQKRFAELFSVDQTAVSNWENGKNSIDLTLADSIAAYFGVPIEYVYGKSYTLKRPREEWSEEEKRTFAAAKSEEARELLSFLYGRGVFEGSNTTVLGEGPSEQEIKVALFGGDGEVSDEMWQEVKEFVAYVKHKHS